MKKIIISLLGSLGYKFLKFVSHIGHFFIFCLTAVSWIIRPPWYFKKISFQILDIGYFSLPVVGLTTFFSGMVLALQTYNGFTEFNSESNSSYDDDILVYIVCTNKSGNTHFLGRIIQVGYCRVIMRVVSVVQLQIAGGNTCHSEYSHACDDEKSHPQSPTGDSKRSFVICRLLELGTHCLRHSSFKV